ncbi:unnamed protein product [Notodromas monacha]|uniref:Uncharacterized protein n=1 Tax=Notodromas monacha TaxID=399045 RepID=A0A7R9BPU6_9CRUS|nr:unnamed protein product [Notodromas monacha]CAG0918110.1 unnamed protein product [Notodromas monacha]
MAKTCCIKCTPIKPPVACEESPGWWGTVKTAALVLAAGLAVYTAVNMLSGAGGSEDQAGEEGAAAE